MRTNMLGRTMRFLRDPANRKLLSWIGGGVVVVATGIWATVQPAASDKPAANVACAQQGSIVAGRDASRNSITITQQGPVQGPGTGPCVDNARR